MSREQTYEILKQPIQSDFLGNEKAFEAHLVEHLEEINDMLNLSKITAIGQQKQIRFQGSQIIMDILTRHEDGSATIYEVKKPNSKNAHTSPFAQMSAIGQLLLYQNVFQHKTSTKPRLVLADNKIHLRTFMAFEGNDLPITLLEFQKNQIFIPYRAF
ncbi:hypothetical protein [Alkalicoccus chagannorensis]|uniref:hypothetical protein n=1 Tax=Alkalicoccus chagannorensis TaxID=427072 RepID=UPI0012EB2D8F|nr:hypothetical protein [Alkalicoccus chagannorensis]